MLKIEFKKDTRGIYGTLPERVAKGIFVECHGHGEFDVFKSDDVKVLKKKTLKATMKFRWLE